MSRQSEAKAKQGYVPKPQTCSNCLHFHSEIVDRKYLGEEKNLRCGIGGFAVKKMATCNEWAAKDGGGNV
jgi:hypothetical protein